MGIKEWASRGKYNCSLGDVVCVNGKIRQGLKSWPVAGAHCTVESGAATSRMTLTRVGAGAVVLGPVGAILGGLARKDKTRVYVILEVGGSVLSFDLPAKDEREARSFAQKVNAASDHFSSEA